MVELLAQTGLNAIYAASYMSLVAVGLVLIFGVMGVINFAHGELYMLGAYVVVALYADLQMPFILVVAVGMIFVGLVGLGMDRVLFRPLRDNPLGGLVVSIGFLMVLQALAVMGFGVRMEHVPPVTQEVIVFSEKVRLAVPRLFVIIAAVVLLTALWVFLVVAAADVGGYFAGRLIGGPKLWPRVSPNKTWAGAGGGAALAVGLGGLFSWATTGTYFVQVCAVSAGVAVLSQGGDLAESALKRHFGVKDSGRLLPGHGGALDRFDGLAAAVLAVALITWWRGTTIFVW